MKQKSTERCYGISKVGEKGQIVIPIEARKMFEIVPGDMLVFLCDKTRGMALVKASSFENLFDQALPTDSEGEKE